MALQKNDIAKIKARAAAPLNVRPLVNRSNKSTLIELAPRHIALSPRMASAFLWRGNRYYN